MTDSRIVIVTVTYSPGEHLSTFLDSIPKACSRPYEVILADNGSTDGSPEAAAERPGVRLLRTGGNIGYGAAINRAVAEIDPDIEFVIIVNPDIEWGRSSIDVLLDAAHRWPRAGSLGPLIREPDGSVYPSAREVPTLGAGSGHAVLGKIWPKNPWTARYRQQNAEISERTAGWLSGSCLLVRRRAFDSIGGFDSRYFMYMEDVDFGDRLSKAGWQNVYVPSAEVTHAQGHSASKHPEIMLTAHHDSAYRFLSDRHPKWWQSPLRMALRAGLKTRSRVAVRSALRAQAREAQRLSKRGAE